MQISLDVVREKTMKQTHPYIHQITATATKKQAVRANKHRIALLIFNNEAANIVEVVSKQDAIYGRGIPVEPKACYENEKYCQGEYWVICNTGLTADVRIEEDMVRE